MLGMSLLDVSSIIVLPSAAALQAVTLQTCLSASHPVQLLYDGQDAEAVRLLTLVRHVTLVHIHPPFASAAEQVKRAGLWRMGLVGEQ